MCFKYATEADFSEPLVCEARGIIIDVVWRVVVCRPFDKFFNVQEQYAADIDWKMGTSEIGKALGAVASYAVSRDVMMARVVFCDADAYDAGYLTPDDISGKVRVLGRGGTKLQPAVDLLQRAKDFPNDGPLLIITDGGIENHLDIKRDHAYILSSGCRLPFRAKGEVFICEFE